jgi:hypothetical protein
VGAPWPAWLVTVSIPIAAALSCIRAIQAWRPARKEGAEAAESASLGE